MKNSTYKLIIQVNLRQEIYLTNFRKYTLRQKMLNFSSHLIKELFYLISSNPNRNAEYLQGVVRSVEVTCLYLHTGG